MIQKFNFGFQITPFRAILLSDLSRDGLHFKSPFQIYGPVYHTNGVSMSILEDELTFLIINFMGNQVEEQPIGALFENIQEGGN